MATGSLGSVAQLLTSTLRVWHRGPASSPPLREGGKAIFASRKTVVHKDYWYRCGLRTQECNRLRYFIKGVAPPHSLFRQNGSVGYVTLFCHLYMCSILEYCRIISVEGHLVPCTLSQRDCPDLGDVRCYFPPSCPVGSKQVTAQSCVLSDRCQSL